MRCGNMVLSILLYTRDVSRRSRTGGPRKSLILAPWSKVEEWRPHPLKFLPCWKLLEPFQGAPACAWIAPYSSCLIIFFFLSSSLSLFLPLFSFPFPFFFLLFWRPFSDRGGRPQKPLESPRIRPCTLYIILIMHGTVDFVVPFCSTLKVKFNCIY